MHGVRGTRDFWLESALIVCCSSSSCISGTRDENLPVSAFYLADSIYVPWMCVVYRLLATLGQCAA